MPGFMQFLTGIYLFAGLSLFGTFHIPAARSHRISTAIQAWIRHNG
jgi:hypothetical protein